MYACEFMCMYVYVLGAEGDLSHIRLQRGPAGVMKRSCLALFHNGMSIGSKLCAYDPNVQLDRYTTTVGPMQFASILLS